MTKATAPTLWATRRVVLAPRLRSLQGNRIQVAGARPKRPSDQMWSNAHISALAQLLPRRILKPRRHSLTRGRSTQPPDSTAQMDSVSRSRKASFSTDGKPVKELVPRSCACQRKWFRFGYRSEGIGAERALGMSVATTGKPKTAQPGVIGIRFRRSQEHGQDGDGAASRQKLVGGSPRDGGFGRTTSGKLNEARH